MADQRLTVKVNIDIAETVKMFQQAPFKLMGAMRKLFQTTVQLIRLDLISFHLTGGTTTTRVARRHGKLIESLRSRVRGNTLETLEGEVHFVDPGAKYAPTHVLGTVSKGGQLDDIYSKQGKYLPIPIMGGKALTAGGTLRGGPRSSVFGDTFVQRSRAGNLIIFGRLARQRGAQAGSTYGGIQPLFVLKKSVSVPPRVDMFGVAQRQVELLERTANTRLATMLQKS